MKRSYSRDFKLRVVKQILLGEKSIAQICRENNIGDNVIRRWKQEYEELGESAWQNSPATGGVVWLDPVTTSVPGSELLCEKRLIQEQQSRISSLEQALGRSHLECEFLREVLSKKGCPPLKR